MSGGRARGRVTRLHLVVAVVLAAASLGACAGSGGGSVNVMGTARSWIPMAPVELAGRYAHVTVWTGREMIVWGGYDNATRLADGAAYDPAADWWTPLATTRFKARADMSDVWTGRELLLWGARRTEPGITFVSGNDGSRFVP